jgi:glycosyltransferase involved in cell wall biosynthesis
VSPAAAAPAVVYLSNVLAPYRLHLLRRISREMPEVRVLSLFTHDDSGDSPWSMDAAGDINPVFLGKGRPSAQGPTPRFALREWRKGGRVIRFLREHDVRAVVSVGYNDPGRLRVLRWCNRHGVPFLLWGDSNVCGDRAVGLRGRVKRAVLPRILRRCAAVLPCGSRGKAFFARYGVDEQRMFLHPLEPDYELIERLPAERVAEVKLRLGLSDRRRRLLFSGRMVPLKRVETLIEAFARVADMRPAWDLVLVGEGPEQARWEAAVPPELAERVIWAGFIANQGDVSAVYRACDVLVLPSDSEAWSLVMLEAAAAGLALVSSDVVGVAAEVVRDGVNGFTFPPGDVSKLAGCLLEVTEKGNVDVMKAASRQVLADWRQAADPVEGLRAALRFCGVVGRA